MKRKSARTKGEEVKTEAKKQEEMATLLFLPPEMVVMVASYLDVSSYLAFASSSMSSSMAF